LNSPDRERREAVLLGEKVHVAAARPVLSSNGSIGQFQKFPSAASAVARQYYEVVFLAGSEVAFDRAVQTLEGAIAQGSTFHVSGRAF